jgi:chemotaxis signal transduction protein
MSAEDPAFDAAREMRRTFDETFRRAPEPAAAAEPLLAIRAGGEALAIRLDETRGFAKIPFVLPLPPGPPERLGLCGLRGQLLPVLDLAALLGAPASEPPGWLILCGTVETLALAVAEFEGQRSAFAADFFPRAGAPRPHVRQEVRLDGVRRGLVDLRSIVRDVNSRAADAAKER